MHFTFTFDLRRKRSGINFRPNPPSILDENVIMVAVFSTLFSSMVSVAYYVRTFRNSIVIINLRLRTVIVYLRGLKIEKKNGRTLVPKCYSFFFLYRFLRQLEKVASFSFLVREKSNQSEVVVVGARRSDFFRKRKIDNIKSILPQIHDSHLRYSYARFIS